MRSESASPPATREKMSRPNWSVPNQWAALGPWSDAAMFCCALVVGGEPEHGHQRQDHDHEHQDQADDA